MKKGLIIGVIILAVLIIVVGIYYYSYNKPSSNCTTEECAFFSDWLTKPLSEKEIPTNDIPPTKPLISKQFFESAFKNFTFSETRDCIMHEIGAGRGCWEEDYFNATKIDFDVEVQGVKLPSGYVIIYSDKIVEYRGPYSDFSSVISKEEAVNLVKNSDICQKEGTIDFDKSFLQGYGSYAEMPIRPEDQLGWQFEMDVSEQHPNCGAVCAVNAVNGSIELGWMCMGAII